MSSKTEYWIFADESEQDGRFFSKFFGGCILPYSKVSAVEKRLNNLKKELGFGKELKWQRVTDQRLGDYKVMVTHFFDEMRNDSLKMRVMFQDNKTRSQASGSGRRHEAYFKLYYQFIKHAFGLHHAPEELNGCRLRLFFDQFPHTHEHAAQFKAYLLALPLNSQLRHHSIKLDPSHITEIDSKEHVILQCVDIVLGSMAFRFNEKHLAKTPDSRTRGKRTIAKEKLYKHILSEIRTLKPYFNPKISTASDPFPEGAWSMPYRHWLFVPNTGK